MTNIRLKLVMLQLGKLHIDLENLSENRNDTGGLHGTLKVAIGARVMLVANIDVSDGLVNGAREVVHNIVTNTNHTVLVVSQCVVFLHQLR